MLIYRKIIIFLYAIKSARYLSEIVCDNCKKTITYESSCRGANDEYIQLSNNKSYFIWDSLGLKKVYKIMNNDFFSGQHIVIDCITNKAAKKEEIWCRECLLNNHKELIDKI